MTWGLLAGVLMLSGAATADAAESAEQAVIAAEHQVLKALQTNNVELWGTMLADSYVNTDQDGTVLVGKAANIADQKLTNITSLEETDLKVTVYGDAAVSTLAFAGKGTYKDKPIEGQGRVTNTWVKMNGKWLCVATHVSFFPKKK